MASSDQLAAASGDSVSFLATTVGFFQEGGPFMYIILVVFACGIAIAIERLLFLNMTKAANQNTWKALLPMLSQGQFKSAMEAAKKSDSAIGKILVYGLQRSTFATRHDEIELAMEEGLMEILPRLERRTPYLATFANIATLLGLLGTILGLISAFTAVAGADPAEKANLLSESISIAMNTTAFGLMAAIPLILIFSYLQSQTTEIIDSMEMASVKFLNVFKQATAKQDKAP